MPPLGTAGLGGAVTLLLFAGSLWAQDRPQVSEGQQRAPAAFDPADVEFFEKQVRPLLTARCHECHGPLQQKGNLRLDGRATILAGGDTGAAIVPGNPDDSLLIDAVRYGDTYQMPPKSQLPAEEIATLVEWVKRGAPWGSESPPAASPGEKSFDLKSRSRHWSFQALSAAAPPAVSGEDWVRTPIDRYILAGLEKAGLKPAPAADKHALLRRVTFDLIGLPPTPAEIEAFIADDSAGAYARVVDRLLASPHYGERWARHWLDLVRYAETHGHEFDFDMPNAFRYRDYVVRALNADLPYDQFVIEHIAGDLLDPPRRNPVDNGNESILATGWYFFGEAKHSPVDVRQDEADRIDNQIDVFAKTFLGLTVACARCHDHKFDAISTKDYYALAGYLQSSRYQQAFIDDEATLSGPLSELKSLRDAQRQALVAFARQHLTPAVDKLADTAPDSLLTRYLESTALRDPTHALHAWAVLSGKPAQGEPEDFVARGAQLAARLRQQSSPAGPGGAKVEFSFTDGTLAGWSATGTAFGAASARALEWMPAEPSAGTAGRVLRAGAAHSGLLTNRLRGVLRSPTFEITKPQLWYRLYGQGGQVRLIVDGLQLIQNPIYGGLKFDVANESPYWHVQDVSKWIGHRAYVELIDEGDGYVALEQLAQGEGAPPAAATNLLFLPVLEDSQVTTAARLSQRCQQRIAQVLSEWLQGRAPPEGEAADRAGLLEKLFSPPLIEAFSLTTEMAELQAALAATEQRRAEIASTLPVPRRAMAIADGSAENEHVFIRGSHKALGDEVPRRLLEVLGGTQTAASSRGSGRLELARQLVDPANPLLSRVLVNRLWHHHFGAGIVRSPDDFGVMGQPPTHPELLDYLAGQLVASGWSLKAVHRQIVLSSTYQMSSTTEPVADQLDPQNKLWHRRGLRRLEAEAIRDAMLAVSGRLQLKLEGPSVMPYLTPAMTGRGRPPQSGPADGDGRRSLYLGVRRNFLSPMFQAFDYPTPFTTIGRRSTSNVPAQALALLNNPLVVEQARKWAESVVSQSRPSDREHIQFMYLTAFGREAAPLEIDAAAAFVTQSGGGIESWTDLAHVLFNAKEFIFIP